MKKGIDLEQINAFTIFSGRWLTPGH